LDSGEGGLEEDDEEDEDGEGEITGRRGVAERFPADEKNDDTGPEDRTKSAEKVQYNFPKILGAFLSHRVSPIALESTSRHCSIETTLRRDVELLTGGFNGVDMKGKLVEKFRVILLLVLPARLFGRDGVIDMDRERPEMHWGRWVLERDVWIGSRYVEGQTRLGATNGRQLFAELKVIAGVTLEGWR
jgi:hypothetical protein